MNAAAVGRVVQQYWSLGSDALALSGATAVFHPAASDHPLGTFLCDVRTEDIDAVLSESHQVTGTPFTRVLVDPDTPAPAEAHLALHDWQLDIQLQLVLPETTAVPSPTAPPRPVEDNEDWLRIYDLFRIDHLEEDRRAGKPARPEAASRSAVALRRSLSPAATYFLAERDGHAVGCIAAWAHDGVGIVEDVFVHPANRGSGIATDMIRHAVLQARDCGAGPILIGAQVDDTPKHLYARFGFRPAAVLRSYTR
jgi:GNAT superfamily N-acetyltransferase